ncbi:transposase [Serratia marcescens]|uniref:transposase n=1 Tax=Serratia marcescens TaxID=615 RepID=UPI000B63E37F|nr:transposase [Serratia marcescens]OUI70443.1 hypothetical protein AZZ99_004769 [Serratia marcescens]
MKFSLQDKLSAVRHYLAGLGSQRQTARKFSVAHVQLRRWIAAYLLPVSYTHLDVYKRQL